jgi:hypothetical protein
MSLFMALLYGPAARCKPKVMIWKVGLAHLYPAYCGDFELLAIMDIRARSISFGFGVWLARAAPCEVGRAAELA